MDHWTPSLSNSSWMDPLPFKLHPIRTPSFQILTWMDRLLSNFNLDGLAPFKIPGSSLKHSESYGLLYTRIDKWTPSGDSPPCQFDKCCKLACNIAPHHFIALITTGWQESIILADISYKSVPTQADNFFASPINIWRTDSNNNVKGDSRTSSQGAQLSQAEVIVWLYKIHL